MKVTLSDLNEYLFEQLERLTNEDLDEVGLEKEIKRGDAVTKIAKTIVDNGALALQAKKHMDEYGHGESMAIPLLGVDSGAGKKEKGK